MKKPNLFVIGAPKCGTTALCNYLSEHPDVFFSEPKELHFFSKDFPEGSKHNNFRDQSEYLEYFREADKFSILGEGSTRYLLSREAVPNILEFQPEARFIVMLRNPIDLFLSLHAHHCYLGEEDLTSPIKAWNAQWDRLHGHRFPPGCRDIESLYYQKVCSLGEQVKRFLDNVDRSRARIFFFEDFKKAPAETYNEILAFLGLPHDGRVEFPILNRRKPRGRFINFFVGKPPKTIMRMVEKGKSAFGVRRLGIMNKIQRKASGWSAYRSSDLPLSFRSQLRYFFSSDVQKLAELTGKDLSHWLKDP